MQKFSSFGRKKSRPMVRMVMLRRLQFMYMNSTKVGRFLSCNPFFQLTESTVIITGMTCTCLFIFCQPQIIQTFSAKHSSNKCKNKVTKKLLIAGEHFEYNYEEVINTLAPKLTPREKIEFEVIHILMKKMLHVSSKQNGASF